MRIAIYQINPDRDENNVAFLNYESQERFQGSAALRSEIYDKVFEGEVECGTLEEVYQMFNLDHPDGYRGRSLPFRMWLRSLVRKNAPSIFATVSASGKWILPRI